jgi:hypothetical protein
MKATKLILCLGILTAGGIGVALLRSRTVPLVSPPAEIEVKVGMPMTPAAPTRELSPTASVQPPTIEPPEVQSETANSATIRADEVLATVNGKKIQLGDLVALPPNQTETLMTAEQYEFRLNRAIEMELTFQAAQARGLSLSQEQEQRLKKLAQDHQTTLHEYGQQGFSWSSVTPAQLDFEQRLTSALMLQQNLVAMETSVAPSSDPDIQARYEQSRSEVLTRLKTEFTVAVE